MRTIPDVLLEHPFFAGLDRPTLELLAGCAVNVHRHAGEYFFHAGEPADRFYAVRAGRVAIEMGTPASGSKILEAVDEGDVVGWSWLVPPYRWTFDARATTPTSAVAFDAICLRAKCDADPAIGYDLLQRVTQVMLHRLQAARVRLMDVYGPAGT